MRRSILELVLIMAVAGTGVGLRAQAQESSAAPPPDSAEVATPHSSRMPAEQAGGIPDLTGYWRLDLEQSDPPWARDRKGGERGPGMRRDGGGIGSRRMGGGPMGRGRPRGGPGGDGRPARLPALIHVTHTPSLMSFEDSTGAVVQEITTGAAGDTSLQAPGAQRLKGLWKEGKLEVGRRGPRGSTVTETYSLEEAGKTLVIHTRLVSDGAIPSRDFKRIYRKES